MTRFFYFPDLHFTTKKTDSRYSEFSLTHNTAIIQPRHNYPSGLGQMMMDDACYEVESKDDCVRGYDDTDAGFTVLPQPPKFSNNSELSAEDTGTQQRIFDRLPLTTTQRSNFYDWLTTEYAQEQEKEEKETEARRALTKRRRT